MQLEQDPIHRHKDVLAHTIAVVANTRPELRVRLAALLHDVGKPKTRSFATGGVSFHHHEVVGARMAEERLRALQYPNDVVDDVTKLVLPPPAHPHVRDGVDRRGGAPLRARRRPAARRPEPPRALRLHDPQPGQGRARSTGGWTTSRRASPTLREQEELDRIRPPLDGRQVMAFLGVPPGPVVGDALDVPARGAPRRGPDRGGRRLRAPRGLGAREGDRAREGT